jgi:DNA-binding response OmpR family regulator
MSVVLLVSCDEDTETILRAAFESRGHRVLVAPTGEEGLQLAEAERPDVILGDFPMDVPGHSPFTRAARAQGEHGALIVTFSARALPGQITAAEAVSDTVITKPQDPLDVVDRVEQLLSGTAS